MISVTEKGSAIGTKQIIAANMPLTDAEAQKFWPLYEQYNAEKVKINDDKLLVIKDYAANFEKLTDNQAQTLVNKWAQADQSAVQLRTKYIPMFQNVLPGKRQPCFSSWIAESPFCWICSWLLRFLWWSRELTCSRSDKRDS
jgi:hypothetical protein